MNDKALMALKNLLWPQDKNEGEQVFWLLDSARNPEIVTLIKGSGLAYTCLFGEGLHPRLQAAAPYLVRLSPTCTASDALLRAGWGHAWGILSQAGAAMTLSQLRVHFKKFLRVKTEEGKELAFRFYDPRVLTVYLPTCTTEEFTSFLGPQTRILAEVEDGGIVQVYECDGEEYRPRPVRLNSAAP
jgi:hypothetical protein